MTELSYPQLVFTCFGKELDTAEGLGRSLGEVMGQRNTKGAKSLPFPIPLHRVDSPVISFCLIFKQCNAHLALCHPASPSLPTGGQPPRCDSE